MSIERKTAIVCPKCKKKGEFTVWNSINASFDPQAKIQLINGEIFRYRCPKCGEIINVNYELLYHQMDENPSFICLALSEKSAKKNIEQFEKMTDENGAGVLPDEYRFRIVSSYNELREKIMIFDRGLDDRTIEVMKLIMAAGFKDNMPDVRIQEIRFNVSMDNVDFFSVFLEDGSVHQAEFPRQLYDEIDKAVKTNLEDGNKMYLVNAQWAAANLKRLK